MPHLAIASARVWHDRVAGLLTDIITDPLERKAVTRTLLSHYLGYDLTKHVLEEGLKVDTHTLDKIREAIKRLKAHEPIQYIIGRAPFLSHSLQVNPCVLIPRPETEEMVSCLLAENDLRRKDVLDIGTGSGCIALALKKACPKAWVAGLDVSPKALAVAHQNAFALGVLIIWYCIDFLEGLLPAKRWDIIVSNPPYVPYKEKKSMRRQVVEYEPSLALFVPDSRPYVFYERIAAIGTQCLRPQGKIYVEFEERSADAVAEIFAKQGFKDVRIYHDLQGKARWLRAQGEAAL